MRGKAAKQAAARKVVSQTINQVNFAAAMLVSPIAAMTPEERMMIEPPLCNYAADNADAFLKGGELIGPLTCVAGVVLWARRLMKAEIIKVPAMPQPGKRRGYNGGPVSRETIPLAHTPQPEPEPFGQPPEPTPIYPRPVDNGYTDLTRQFETFTKIGG